MLKKFEVRITVRDDELNTIFGDIVEANSLIELVDKMYPVIQAAVNECTDYERSKLHDNDTDDLPF